MVSFVPMVLRFRTPDEIVYALTGTWIPPQRRAYIARHGNNEASKNKCHR